jgi:hypothetical protein
VIIFITCVIIFITCVIEMISREMKMISCVIKTISREMKMISCVIKTISCEMKMITRVVFSPTRQTTQCPNVLIFNNQGYDKFLEIFGQTGHRKNRR